MIIEKIIFHLTAAIAKVWILLINAIGGGVKSSSDGGLRGARALL